MRWGRSEAAPAPRVRRPGAVPPRAGGSRLLWLAASLVAVLVMLAARAHPAAAAGARAGEVERVRNGEQPRAGTASLRLEELWRAGGEDDEVIFGAVGQVLMDEAGRIYLLDRQLSQVQVYAPDGEHLRTLSREGEGPGEVRGPRDMLFLDDGTLGMVQMMPGRIVKVTLDGAPAGSISPGGDDPTAGGIGVLFDAASRGGTLVACGESMDPGADAITRIRYLARIDASGRETVRYLESAVRWATGSFIWNEEEDYFVNRGGWTLGPEGRVYAAAARDRYAIDVFAPDGTLERVIERRFERRKRSAEEKEIAGDGMRMSINGRDVEKKLSDYDPCIAGLRVDVRGRLWVQHQRSADDRPPGVFQIYDLFDRTGRYVQRAAVVGPGDPRRDRLVLLGGDRAVMIRGALDAALSLVGLRGQDDQESGEAVPLEVICYRTNESAID